MIAVCENPSRQFSIAGAKRAFNDVIASLASTCIMTIMNRYYFALLLVIATLISVPQVSRADHTSEMRVVEIDGGFLITQGDRKVLFYQRDPKDFEGTYRRANYVHPLYDLDGNVLTEDFPSDHRHHRGIFWAWHQIYVGDQAVGDPWVTKDFLWDVRSVQTHSLSNRFAKIKVELDWKSPKWVDAAGNQIPLVRETTTITAFSAEDGARKIDFEIRLEALVENLRMGGSNDAKGYGGFSTRFRLPSDVKFTGAGGVVTPQRLSVEPSPWMDLSATFNKANGVGGVTTLCHNSLPAFPPRWILRNSRSMQNPLYPGREQISLLQCTPLVLRYRLVVHRGEAEPAKIEQWQEEFQSD